VQSFLQETRKTVHKILQLSVFKYFFFFSRKAHTGHPKDEMYIKIKVLKRRFFGAAQQQSGAKSSSSSSKKNKYQRAVQNTHVITTIHHT
jgi:hypothetical protein